MGCDIHMFKEKLVAGRWMTADEGWTEVTRDEEEGGAKVKYLPWDKRFTDRNYDLFGMLAKGVRREFDFSFEPRGLPLTPCDEVKSASDHDGEDGDNHRVVFWFDN